jgi:hypothetical protein
MAKRHTPDPGERFKRIWDGTVPQPSTCYVGWTTVYSPKGAHGGECALFAPSIEQLRFFWKRLTKLPLKRRHCQRVAYFAEKSLIQPVGKTGGTE